MAFKFITAEEAAEFIHHNDNVGFSGFTAAGTPKVVSVALAKKAEAERKAAKEKQPKKDAEQITEETKSKENASQATTATQKQKKK